MANKNKKRSGVVYSTNADYEYDMDDRLGEAETLPPNKQQLKIMLDRKQRKGKEVTLVTGFVGAENDLKDLGKIIKSKCGVGGTVKNQQILIQGNFIDKIKDILQNEGYKFKVSGV